MPTAIIRTGATLTLAALAFLSCTAPTVLADPIDPSLVEELCRTIRDNYVFPETAERTADRIAERAGDGAYDDLSRQDLAAALTRDLRDFTHDLHFGARPLPEGWTPPQDDGEPHVPADTRGFAPYGVKKIERLEGNIGYLDLRGFVQEPIAHDAILSAVRLLQGSSAIILDLRRNGGGDPATVQLLCSYFFDPAEPVHLNSLYFRPTDETTEFWTNPEFPDLAMPDTPMYVLTSAGTFSGAEECAYNLQTRHRATLIGETTGGGAHPVNGFPIAGSVMLMVPVGRAINPVTNTNWEGTGVVPDIKAPAPDALDTAMELALGVLAASGDPGAVWWRYQRAMRAAPFAVAPSALAEYAGDYTDREITLGSDALMYRRKGSPGWLPLVPVDRDVFMIRDIDDFRMEFDRDGAGRITAIHGYYRDGRDDRSARAD